jgi:hypothetical protein
MRTQLKQPTMVEIAQLKGCKWLCLTDEFNRITVLKNSIVKKGLLQHIVVNSHNRVISGKGRVKACIALGKTEIPAIYIDSAA